MRGLCPFGAVGGKAVGVGATDLFRTVDVATAWKGSARLVACLHYLLCKSLTASRARRNVEDVNAGSSIANEPTLPRDVRNNNVLILG